jgi:exopolysaccharide production protein ExoZ
MTRRLVRIFPLYFMFTSLAAAISWIFPYLRKSGDIPTATKYLLSIFFVPNRTVTGGLVPVLNPGWTLNYEMLFYCVCCAALTISHRFRHALIAAIIILLGLSGSLAASGSVWREFAGNRIILEFLAGVLIWVWARNNSSGSASRWPVVALLGLLVLMSIAETHKSHAKVLWGDWSRPAIYLIPAALVIYVGYVREAAFMSLPEVLRKLLVRLGEASYAIYLTHIFVLGILSFALPRIGMASVGTTLGMLLALGASALVGIGVHEQIDSRIQLYLRRKVQS